LGGASRVAGDRSLHAAATNAWLRRGADNLAEASAPQARHQRVPGLGDHRAKYTVTYAFSMPSKPFLLVGLSIHT